MEEVLEILGIFRKSLAVSEEILMIFNEMKARAQKQNGHWAQEPDTRWRLVLQWP